jgi:hypothetical protein
VQKRPTLRRAVLHALPNVLVIHLKRFEFSYETLNYSKLNQYFEFPEDLDVFPFTAEGLAMGNMSQSQMGDEGDVNRSHPDAYYRYRLHGVVIHRCVCVCVCVCVVLCVLPEHSCVPVVDCSVCTAAARLRATTTRSFAAIPTHLGRSSTTRQCARLTLPT